MRRAHAAAAAALFKCRASSDKVLANGSVGEVLAREHFEKVLPAADCMNMYLLEGGKKKNKVVNAGSGTPPVVKSLPLVLFVCEQRRDDVSAQMRRESRVRRSTPSQTLRRIPPPELLDYNPCLSASTQGHRPRRAAPQKQINEEG